MKQVLGSPSPCSRPHTGLSFVFQQNMRVNINMDGQDSKRAVACAAVPAGSSTAKANVPDATGMACVLGTALHHENFYTTSHQQMYQMQQEWHVY